MLSKVLLYYNTLKFLRWPQVWYRLYYFVRSKIRKFTNFKYKFSIPTNYKWVKLQNTIGLNQSFFGKNKFVFLNKEKDFSNSINWNFNQFGKLWTYNLNYFDFLNQVDANKEDSLELINDFIQKLPNLTDANEPYPISLRLINWVKFLSRNEITDSKINESLKAQAYILKDKLEYHLLGNHLLENSFGLLFASYYLQEKPLFDTANKILRTELKEQILKDGGHFELSPMYHQIIFIRLLDAYNLVINNAVFETDLQNTLKKYAQKMFGWLEQITFSNGDIPHLNDSADEITPESEKLFEYAKQLNIKPALLSLTESGYRKIKGNNFEAVIDVGEIGPSYLPGHAHADTFNFVLYWKNKPLIVDIGTSTYETNALRTTERSTENHNTVTINNKNQSQVWGGFRVAKRANITELIEKENSIKASHNGYDDIGVTHTREFIWDDTIFEINDIVSGKPKNAFASFHFAENSIPIKEKEQAYKINDNTISFVGATNIEVNNYSLAIGFNKNVEAKVLKVYFNNRLTSKIC